MPAAAAKWRSWRILVYRATIVWSPSLR